MRADRSLGETLALQRSYRMNAAESRRQIRSGLQEDHRKHELCRPGVHVRLHPPMAIEGHRDAIIERVDGYDIYLFMDIMGQRVTGIHRFTSEFEIVSADPENIAAAAEKDRLDKKNLDQMFSNCPAERLIGEALHEAGIVWTHESHPDRASDPEGRPRLDFRLDDLGLYIEVKLMHTERVERQLAGVDNVILVQGMAAARWLAAIIKGGGLNG